MSDEWYGLAIGLCYPFGVPKKQLSWVAASGCGPFHIETEASARANGQTWTGLCGETGDCFFIHQRVAEQLKCKACSTVGVLD